MQILFQCPNRQNEGVMDVKQLLGLLFLLLGGLFLFRMLVSGWVLFLLLAAGLALGVAVGAMGRWAYGVAALLLLLALPGLFFKTLFVGLALIAQLAPLLLLLFGIYLLAKR